MTDGDTKFKSLDAGVAGVWAVKVDLNVVVRENTGRDNLGPGSAWSVVPGGKMRWVSWKCYQDSQVVSKLDDQIKLKVTNNNDSQLLFQILVSWNRVSLGHQPC